MFAFTKNLSGTKGNKADSFRVKNTHTQCMNITKLTQSHSITLQSYQEVSCYFFLEQLPVVPSPLQDRHVYWNVHNL